MTSEDLRPAWLFHCFLRLMPPSYEAYNFTYALLAHYEEKYFPVGTCCLIASNLAVTAKHVLEYMYLTVAKKKIDLYDPDILSSPYGHKFEPPAGLELHAVQFLDGRRDARRYSIKGVVGVGFKDSDLLILELMPHQACPYKDLPMPRPPQLDLGPPKVGTVVRAFGFPEHPKNKLEARNAWLSNQWLYRSTGKVRELNFEKGSAQFISYRTTARTLQGMSGGPVFTKRDGNYSFVGVISRGGTGKIDSSVVSPLWQIATACSDNWPGMPQKEGFVWLAELMKDGFIPTKGADLLRIDYDELKVIFDADLNIRDGY